MATTKKTTKKTTAKKTVTGEAPAPLVDVKKIKKAGELYELRREIFHRQQEIRGQLFAGTDMTNCYKGLSNRIERGHKLLDEIAALLDEVKTIDGKST